MRKPLPDYYRILDIEPTASDDAIKVSYRRLMITSKMHPDFGGDHDRAAMINAAYEVLGNSVKRIEYDRAYLLQQLRQSQVRQHPQQRTDSTLSTAQSRPAKSNPENAGAGIRARCPLCGAAQPRSVGPDTRCEVCFSPLSPAPQPTGFGRELFGRRATPRTAKTHSAAIFIAGQTRGTPVKMRDLSLGGLSFYSEIALEDRQVFRFRDATLETVAVVISCRKRGQLYSVHAKMLTVTFHQNAGVFLSTNR